MTAEHGSSHGASTGHADAGHVHVHELSIWPLAMGISAFLVYFSVVYTETLGIFTIIGPLALLGSFVGWYREDHHRYQRPYHPDAWNLRGKHTLWWGMVFFLGTEVMLFGGLFATYFATRPNWPAELPHLPLGATAVNTAILVASSFTFHFAHHNGLLKNNRKTFMGWLGVTIALGAIFLALQVLEYRNLIAEGHVLSQSTYTSIFYMLTGTHGFHVATGLTMLIFLFVRGALGDFSKERDVAVDCVGLYWHFVDVVWILLFLIVYVGVI